MKLTERFEEIFANCTAHDLAMQSTGISRKVVTQLIQAVKDYNKDILNVECAFPDETENQAELENRLIKNIKQKQEELL